MGLTGIPFTDVYNGCATAASALTMAANTIRLGDSDLGIAVGMDKHLPGAFSADPPELRVSLVVRRGRPVRHHEVLRDEDQQVHARPRDLAVDARQGRGEELPQRLAEPECVPAPAAVRGGHPRVADAQLPAHAVHVLQPRRRCRGGRAVHGREGAPLHRPTRSTCARRRCGHVGSARSKCTARGCRSKRRPDRPSTRRGPRSRWPGSARKTST